MRARRRRWVLVWLLRAVLLAAVGLALFLELQSVPPAPVEAFAFVADSHPVPLLMVATNDVLDSVLETISETVQRLELPLETPLIPAKVLRFETRPVLVGRPSSLRTWVEYEGGYEFRHQDGIVYELRTPQSRKAAVEQGAATAEGRVNPESFHAGIELAGPILRRALRRLGHRDPSVIGDNPMVMHWFDWMDPGPERWFLSWTHPTGGGGVATVEIDAQTHDIEHY